MEPAGLDPSCLKGWPHILPTPGLNVSSCVCSFTGSSPTSICRTLWGWGAEVLCPIEGQGWTLSEQGAQSQARTVARTGACPVDRGA